MAKTRLTNQDLDQVAANVGTFQRATVTVASDGRVTAASAGTAPAPTLEEFLGPASSVTLAITPSQQIVYKDGVQQRKVGGVPNEGEYKIVGNTVTITVAAASIVNVFEWA